jgi:tetratricopeptide (TPR) repeat protein
MEGMKRMRQMDALGLDMTISSQAAVQHWNDVVVGALSHAKTTPSALGALLEADPDNTLALSSKSLFLVMLARSEMLAAARDAAAKAADSFAHRGGTAREGRYVAAALLASQGHWWKAIAELEAVLEDEPEDSLAAKVTHGLRFMLGDRRGLQKSIENVINSVGRDHPHIGYLMGCHAFALEENGDYKAAESTGRIAVARAPKDAWGLHAVSHVFEMTGRAQEGVEWLAGREGSYAHCNNFGYHVFWHMALFRLELGDAAGALALYDEKIRSERTDDFRDMANAASLLARIELDGVNVGARWDELADIAERRIADQALVFADLHYLLALLGAGKPASVETLIAQFEAPGEGRLSDQASPARQAGALTGRGLMAFRDKRYGEAARDLVAARKHWQSIGGSHAQRDVFEQFALEALIRCGDTRQAETLLSERQRHRGTNLFAAKRLGALAANENRRVAALSLAGMAPKVN